MVNPHTNRYRNGAKNPHLEVLVSSLDDGEYAVSLVDWANWRILNFKSREVDAAEEQNKGKEFGDGKSLNGC